MADRRVSGPVGVNRGRRRFLVTGLTAGGGFLLGFPSLDLLAESGKGPGSGQIGFFVEIRSSGQIVIGSAQPEIGQARRSQQDRRRPQQTKRP